MSATEPFTQEQEKSFRDTHALRDDAKKLASSLEKYVESTRAATQSGAMVSNALNDMLSADWIKESPRIDAAKYLRYLGSTFRAINSVQTQTVEALQKNVTEPLENFINYDFLEVQNIRKKVTSTHQEYEATRGKIETVLQGKTKGIGKKKIQIPDEKQILEFERELERLKKVQDDNGSQLETKLQELDQKKETKLLKFMLDLMVEQYECYSKAYKVLQNLKPKMDALAAELSKAQEQMEEQTSKEGHLQQKIGGNWQRNYFCLKGGTLICYKGKKDAQTIESTLNVMICTTRIPAKYMKSSIFEIVTPDKKKPIVLQADSEKDRNSWVEAIQNAIEESLNQNQAQNQPSHNIGKDEESRAFKILKKVEGNRRCADCNAEDPDWASINLGILVCLECSGVHRSLGTHISKVRSATLDTKAWEVELLMYMKEIGNEKFNSIMEADIPPEFEKPNPATERSVRERFIKAKYMARAFMVPPENRDPAYLAMELYKHIALTSNESLTALWYILNGADLAWHNPSDEQKTVVHNAVVYDKVTYLECLVQNGGDIFCVEERSWTPMHYASYYHRDACALILFKHGFNGATQLQYKDWQNKTAVELALKGNALNIVSILSGEIVQVFTLDSVDEPDEEPPKEEPEPPQEPEPQVHTTSMSQSGPVLPVHPKLAHLQGQAGTRRTIGAGSAGNIGAQAAMAMQQRRTLTTNLSASATLPPSLVQSSPSTGPPSGRPPMPPRKPA